MATINDFINALQYDWLQKALISAILIGLVCALIGVFIVMRGVIFLGEAISHSAFAGAALIFTFSSKPKLILYLYLNDKNTLRKQSSKTDPWHEVEVVKILETIYTVGNNYMLKGKVVARVSPLKFAPYTYLKWD